MDITQTKRVNCELVRTMSSRKGTLAYHPRIILSASIHCTGLELKSEHNQIEASRQKSILSRDFPS